jgi:hypothetical protein
MSDTKHPYLDFIFDHVVMETHGRVLALHHAEGAYRFTRDDVLALAGELRAIGESMTATHPKRAVDEIQGQLPEAI